MVDLKKFGERVKEERKRLKLTQDALSTMLGGGNRSRITAWEKGTLKEFPSVEVLDALAEIFSCDIDYLLGKLKFRTKAIEQINSVTGLSEAAINRLIFLRNGESKNTHCSQELQFINELISDPDAIAYIYPYAFFDIDNRMKAEITRDDGTVEAWSIDGKVLLNARYDTVREGMNILRKKCMDGGSDNDKAK
jgi:transcriptional regulator with XRE-family HTH domain